VTHTGKPKDFSQQNHLIIHLNNDNQLRQAEAIANGRAIMVEGPMHFYPMVTCCERKQPIIYMSGNNERSLGAQTRYAGVSRRVTALGTLHQVQGTFDGTAGSGTGASRQRQMPIGSHFSIIRSVCHSHGAKLSGGILWLPPDVLQRLLAVRSTLVFSSAAQRMRWTLGGSCPQQCEVMASHFCKHVHTLQSKLHAACIACTAHHALP
jgi:hypothetical protein